MEKLDFIDSKFRLAILAAKRAKQIVNGSKRRVDVTAENPLTVAIEEIFRGKVKFKILSDAEVERLEQGFVASQYDEEEIDDLLMEDIDESDTEADEDEDEDEVEDEDEEEDDEDDEDEDIEL